MKYSRVSIVQASYLKERLEELEVERDEVTIASVDDINMYPSIKILTIKKSVRFFAIKLTAITKKTINLCLELIRFGMRTILCIIIKTYESLLEYYDIPIKTPVK